MAAVGHSARKRRMTKEQREWCRMYRRRVLQIGHWEVASTQDNGHGETVNVMELRWHDVPFEPNP